MSLADRGEGGGGGGGGGSGGAGGSIDGAEKRKGAATDRVLHAMGAAGASPNLVRQVVAAVGDATAEKLQ